MFISKRLAFHITEYGNFDATLNDDVAAGRGQRRQVTQGVQAADDAAVRELFLGTALSATVLHRVAGTFSSSGR